MTIARFIRRISLMLLILTLVGLKGFSQCEFLNQKVSVNLQDVTYEEAMLDLAKTHNFNVSFASQAFDNTTKINVVVKREAISTILRSICVPNQLEYACVGENSIVIRAQANPIQIVSGFIIDSASRQPITSATILSQADWISSDQDGYFQINVLANQPFIEVHAMGYDSKRVKLHELGPNVLIHIALSSNRDLVPTIIDINDSATISPQLGGLRIDIDQLSKVPSIAGAPGVLNSMRFFSSIQSTIDVNGGLVVRGGGTDQNLVLFDGMEIYNPMHLFGLFSLFDNNSVQHVSFFQNYFPAEYGGRLSSVLSLKSKVGSYDKWHTRLNVNPVLLEARADGPIVKNKSSLNVTGRRSFTDFFPLFYEAVQNQNNLSEFNTFFYDASASYNHKISNKTTLYLTGYIGGDQGVVDKNFVRTNNSSSNYNSFNQSTSLLTVGLKSWVANKLSLQVMTGISQFKFSQVSNESQFVVVDTNTYTSSSRLKQTSTIADWKSGVYANTRPNEYNKLRLGMEQVMHAIHPRNGSYTLIENANFVADSTWNYQINNIPEQRLFIQNIYRKGKAQIIGGIHMSSIKNDVVYWNLQPRINVQLNAKPKLSFEMNYGEMAQYFLQIPNSGLGVPSQIWLPVNEEFEPMLCKHYNLGVKKQLGKNIQLDLWAYFKDFTNVYELSQSESSEQNALYDALLHGDGTSKGIELSMKRQGRKWNSLLAYTLSKTTRTVEGINKGNPFPYQFDRLHDLKGFVHYQLNQSLSVGINWIYASGHNLTIPEEQYLLEVNGKQQLIQVFGDYNNFRLPAYHRLDFGVHHSKKIENAVQTWSLTVYNAYNRANAYYVDSRLGNTGELILQPVSVLPILPSLNYAIVF